MGTQNREAMEKRLIRWLLIATLFLVVLVLGLQAWQLLRSGAAPSDGRPLAQDADPRNPQTAESSGGPAVVSPGKAAMAEDVRARNPDLPLDDLAALSAEELEQLCQAKTPPDRVPIGLSLAAYQAEEYAGTLEADSVTWDADPELDETPAHYEVELHHVTLGDFAYKVDAYTGEVLEGKPDILQSVYVPSAGEDGQAGPGPAPSVSGAPSQDGSQVPQPSASSGRQPETGASAPPAGEEAAAAAAFAFAGISEDDAENVRTRTDWEDGVQIYEVTFRSGGVEYDYEIEAATGAILKSEEKWGGVSRPSGGLIAEGDARTAALAHAKVQAEDVSYIRAELDEDDGLWLYEIEFRSGGVEYEYEIDAATGAVRKAEQDREGVPE